MIKGKATIQLFDEKSGEVVKELHEENMITNAVDTILNPPDYIEIGMDSDNDRSFNLLRDFAGNIADTAFRGVIVCRDKIPEDGNNMMLPWTNEEIGHAGIANTNTDTSIGTYNANESDRIENGNAVTAQSQEAYLKKYESLTKRYETAAAELARLQNLRTLRSQKDKAVALYIRTLKKQPTVLSEWNDTLWTVMVEKAIVHRNSEITFVFYNGTKVKVRQ